jgi:hypothetical protein
MNRLKELFSRPMTRATRVVVSFAIGLAVAIILDYVLYRIGLPSKPFIYVAF